MAEGDFPEEEFDDLPEDFEDEIVSGRPPKKAQPVAAPAPTRQPAQLPPQSRQRPVQAAASAPVQTPQQPRYVPFVLPARSGVFDNLTNRPLMEDPDKSDLMLGLLAEILNRLDRIEQGL